MPSAPMGVVTRGTPRAMASRILILIPPPSNRGAANTRLAANKASRSSTKPRASTPARGDGALLLEEVVAARAGQHQPPAGQVGGHGGPDPLAEQGGRGAVGRVGEGAEEEDLASGLRARERVPRGGVDPQRHGDQVDCPGGGQQLTVLLGDAEHGVHHAAGRHRQAIPRAGLGFQAAPAQRARGAGQAAARQGTVLVAVEHQPERGTEPSPTGQRLGHAGQLQVLHLDHVGREPVDQIAGPGVEGRVMVLGHVIGAPQAARRRQAAREPVSAEPQAFTGRRALVAERHRLQAHAQAPVRRR